MPFKFLGGYFGAILTRGGVPICVALAKILGGLCTPVKRFRF